MCVDAEDSALLRHRLELLRQRMQGIRAGRRVLMDLLAVQMEEKRRLNQDLLKVRREHRRWAWRCLRLQARLEAFERSDSQKESPRR